MKVIKPVKFPVNILIQGLQDSKPNYIAISGVRVNLNEVAASVIEGLIQQVDDVLGAKLELQSIMERLLPDICRLADLSDMLSHEFASDSSDGHEAGPPASTAATHCPTATVITAIVHPLGV